MASDDTVINNNELDRTWKVAVLTKFEVLPQQLPGGTK
jgi:hypothetical protein